MKRLYLVVEHRQPDRLIRLQQEIAELQLRNDALHKSLSTLEQKYGYEVLLNSELIDLCKMYNVPFRKELEFKKFPF